MGTSPSTYFSYATPFGPITVGQRDSSLTAIALGRQTFEGLFEASLATNGAATQLLEYFAGKRTVFDLPLSLEGTAFQMKVWDAISNIPYGQTRTTKEIAEAIGNPQGFRLVGKAVHENPLAIVIPSHRIVAANGYVDKNDTTARIWAAFRELECRHS